MFLVGWFSIRIVFKLLLGVWMKFVNGRIFNGDKFSVNVIVGFVIRIKVININVLVMNEV